MTLAGFSFKHLRANRDKVSAKEYNRLVDLAAAMARSLVSSGIMDASGFSTRTQQSGVSFKKKVFIVQSAATGDGVYTCREAIFDGSDWDDTGGADRINEFSTAEIEVFNLYESNPLATYSRALAYLDIIQAWRWRDDDGDYRWVGIPLATNPMRSARTTQAAPALAYITANLYNHAGVEIEDGLGSGIIVYCDIVGGTKLDEAIPQLPDNFDLAVQNIQGKWFCNSIFQTYDTDHFQVVNSVLQDKLDTCE